MRSARTVTGWLLIGLLGGALAQGCGSSARPQRNPGSGAAAGSAGKDAGMMTVEPPGNSGKGGQSTFDPLCGISETAYCVPDFGTNSLCLDGPAGTGGKGGSAGGSSTSSGTGGSGGAGGSAMSTGGTEPAAGGGAGGESGAQSAGAGASQAGAGAGAGEAGSGTAQAGQGGEHSGAAGEPPIGVAGATGESATGGTFASGGRSGSAGQGPVGISGETGVPSQVSCQVVENPKHKGAPLATCRASGTGTKGAPCFSGADCAPKFACVGDGPGQCLPYCCSGPEQCQAYTGTHCAVETLVPEEKGVAGLQVPVCTPAVKCSLAEPYPCPPGVTCSCPDESACVVVSDDGTTSCLPLSELPPEGSGRSEDSPCPCWWGWVCSQATNHCVKLCEVAAPDISCGSGGRCQSSGALPAGWGTCVGVTPDGGAP